MLRRSLVPVGLVAVLALTAACTSPDPDDGGSPSPSASTTAPTPGSSSTTPTAPATTPPAEPEPTEPQPGADPTTPPATGTSPGRPVLVSATLVGGNVEMSGYVEGTLVDGQQCRFELVVGSTVTAATSTSAADASTTLCPGVSIPAPPGSASGWRARLVWVPSGATSEAVSVVTQ